MPPPFVGESRDALGKSIYILPPSVGNGRPYTWLLYMDLFQHPEKITRQTSHIPGYNRDTVAINHRNAERNEDLGLEHDWRELWGSEEGKICVLVCPGPSLARTLPEVQRLQACDNVFSMTFNRGFRAVDADYFVCLDRNGQRDWIPRDPGRTKLIAATTSAAHVNAHFHHRYWGDSCNEGIDFGFELIGKSGLGITQCEAMLAAYRLGAKEIVLYGSDFALSGAHVEQGEKSHYVLAKYYFDSRPKVGLEARARMYPEHAPVLGIGGQLCFTNYELWSYASYVTCMCMMLEKVGVKVRNKSGAGILRWGVE
jgi:hypothetical protein